MERFSLPEPLSYRLQLEFSVSETMTVDALVVPGFSAPRGNSSGDDGDSSGVSGLYEVKSKLGWFGPQAMRRMSKLAGFSLPLMELLVVFSLSSSTTLLLPAASAIINDCKVPLLLRW